MKKAVFTGAAVALVTPFHKDGSINYGKLEELIDYQIENSTDAIVVCATTGESPTLSYEEHEQIVRRCVEHVAGRVPVIAGTGSNDTKNALKLSNDAERAGADGLLMVTPYYNKTSQAGLIEHFNFIADRVSTPIILYNVPSRTGLNIKPETYYELSKHKNIVAAKEANGDISALAQTVKLCGDELTIYSGNDDQITAFMSLGAKGVISVLSNIAPRAVHDMVKMYLDGDTAASTELQLKYLDLCSSLFSDVAKARQMQIDAIPLIEALFCEVNPIPVKEAMNMMGMEVGSCRLPLAQIQPQAKEKLRRSLSALGMI